MRRQASGQSMVEMAFVLPILLVLLFGIMEFGYFIYAYSSVSQAARNGAEVAAQLPPHQSWMDLGTGDRPDGMPAYRDDQCVGTIFNAISSDATLFGDNVGRRLSDYVTISYPSGGQTRNLRDRGPIEVTIRYPVNGITPLFSLLGMSEGITLTVTQRRSLENLGLNPSSPTGKACAEDVEDWNDINPPTP